MLGKFLSALYLFDSLKFMILKKKLLSILTCLRRLFDAENFADQDRHVVEITVHGYEKWKNQFESTIKSANFTDKLQQAIGSPFILDLISIILKYNCRKSWR